MGIIGRILSINGVSDTCCKTWPPVPVRVVVHFLVRTTHAVAILNETETYVKKRRSSLLDRLKNPTPADIARPRKIRKNQPPRGKRTCRGTLGSDPKGVSPSQRVREFPTEPSTVSHGQLFCSACREQLSLKRSILKNHVESVKHRNSKERLARKGARERDIASSLKKYNEQVHPRGETA